MSIEKKLLTLLADWVEARQTQLEVKAWLRQERAKQVSLSTLPRGVAQDVGANREGIILIDDDRLACQAPAESKKSIVRLRSLSKAM